MNATDDIAAAAGIDRNVATNVREHRDRCGMSQEELAQQMSDRGFGFSQATIWKIESGQRPVRLGEAVALAEILQLRNCALLTEEPELSRHRAHLQQANRWAHNAYGQIKQAAAAYLEAQANVLVAAREAHDAGLTVTTLSTSYLGIAPEQAVIEARVEWGRTDVINEQINDEVTAILQALRDSGHEPDLPRPEDLEFVGGDTLPVWTPQ
jgi:transcriptional regulator with XRE-family HTH domain